MEQACRHIFHLYNFHEIRTPIFEDTQLFARGVGEETDIVSKEMFTWEDKARAQSEKAQSLTLRPENTAGVVRAYIEHKMGDTGKLQKLYYIGPQFRRERPQKGRYRQFYQIGAEVLGPRLPAANHRRATPRSLPCWRICCEKSASKNGLCTSTPWATPMTALATTRRSAKRWPGERQDVRDCQRRAETNPLRVLDCKVPEDQPIIDALPKISGFLSEESREHFNEVKKILNHVGIRYEVNERMVRGLDYYTRTTFEFTHGGLGAQSALLGGGRYDGLSEMLGGPKAPGIGFALGLDRFVLALQAEETVAVPNLNPTVFIAPLGPGMNAEAAVIARELRKSGVATELGDDSFKVKKSFEAAERAGAKHILFVGENEITSGQFAIKNYGDWRTGKRGAAGNR